MVTRGPRDAAGEPGAPPEGAPAVSEAATRAKMMGAARETEKFALSLKDQLRGLAGLVLCLGDSGGEVDSVRQWLEPLDARVARDGFGPGLRGDECLHPPPPAPRQPLTTRGWTFVPIPPQESAPVDSVLDSPGTPPVTDLKLCAVCAGTDQGGRPAARGEGARAVVDPSGYPVRAQQLLP